jgi:GDP-mannose 6-dehydrogenase
MGSIVTVLSDLSQITARPVLPRLSHDTTSISVIGLGYVGAVSCGCLSALGHRVVGVDLDPRKTAAIEAGRSPIHEAHLDDLLSAGIAEHLLTVTSDAEAAILDTDVTFVSVGTPSRDDGTCETRNVLAVAQAIGRALARKDGYHAVVLRCSIPPGTTAGPFLEAIERVSGKRVGQDFGLAFCPEFMREGVAVEDFREPAKTVIGASDDRVRDIVARIFAPVDAHPVYTSIETAEMVKYVDNVWHALKVCFGNEVGRLATALRVDGGEVMDVFCKDTKLNISPTYLRPGFAYGGSCLPKEVRSVMGLAKNAGLDLPLIGNIAASNDRHIEEAVERVVATGARTVGVLGLTFKPGTDDLRESPTLTLIARLQALGIRVVAHDPIICPRVFRPRATTEALYPDLAGTDLRRSVEDVVAEADLLVLTQHTVDYRMETARARLPVIDLAGCAKPAGAKARPISRRVL